MSDCLVPLMTNVDENFLFFFLFWLSRNVATK